MGTSFGPSPRAPRAADHIAWQLVLANGGTPPVIAGGISAQAAALVEDFQPYNNSSGAPEEDPLYLLCTLNNIDKHREFNLAVLYVTEMLEAHLLTEDGTGLITTIQFLSNVGRDEPITDGAAVGQLPFRAGAGQKWAVGVEARLGLQETEELRRLGPPTLFELAETLLSSSTTFATWSSPDSSESSEQSANSAITTHHFPCEPSS